MEENQEILVEETKEVTPEVTHLTAYQERFHYFVFIVGFLAILISQVIAFEIINLIGQDKFTAASYSATTNFLIYIMVFTTMIIFLLIQKKLKAFASEFTKLKPYIFGVFYGFFVIITSLTITLIMNLIFGETDSNINQQTVESILKNHPFSSFFWIVLMGPIVEELTYRVGLFGALRKKNRILAYVVSALIFGFIHFNIPIDEATGGVDYVLLGREFINLPGYIASGLLFAYAYEKEGFGTATVAHVTNNYIPFLLGVIQSYGK